MTIFHDLCFKSFSERETFLFWGKSADIYSLKCIYFKPYFYAPDKIVEITYHFATFFIIKFTNENLYFCRITTNQKYKMYSNRDSFQLYYKQNIRKYFETAANDITSSISRDTDDYILNVNVDEYIDYLLNKYIIDFPTLLFDEVSVDYHEDEVPSDYFDSMRWHVRERKSYPMQIIEYYIPYDGDINILEYSPSSRIIHGGGYNGKLSRTHEALKYEFINFSYTPEQINGVIENFKNEINKNYQQLKSDCNNLHQQLRGEIKNTVESRKQKILSQRNVLSSLGIPLRKKNNTPKTFSIPKPALRKKIVINRPEVLEKGFKPEPALDKETYNQILTYINDVGKNFENKPSLYSDKGEEDLRDHILLILDPNFELGSATGETFNKSGKTDILLKYDSSVVFIAECKFWNGESQYLKTIDQLLGYLTWRNSKSSVIIFSKNKEFTDVLRKIELSTPKHSNFLKFESKQGETWFNYKFHINGDRNRIIDLTVQVFNIP